MSKFKPSHSSAVRPRPAKRPAGTQVYAVQDRQTGGLIEENGERVDGLPPSVELPPNAVQRMGFIAVALFIFFRFSFAHEFVAAKLNINTHVIILLGAASYLFCILSGQMAKAFRERTTFLWCGFLACMSIATVTSFWKGGSFPLWVDYLETVFPVVFVLPALTTTRSQLIKMLSTIGVACIAMVALGMFNHDLLSGRMNIDAAGSDIQDPNDYAAHLILMLPALAFLTLRAGRPVLLKLIGLAAFAFSFRQILSTGSRGGLLSLAITALYIAVIGSNKVRLAILVGGPILGLLAVPFIPSESAARLSLLFSSPVTANNAEAAESQDARLALLKASGKATLQHPLFGVGPGIFMDYQAITAGESGQRGMWHVTHNSYTQISSECGIPAAILYIGALGSTFLMLRAAGKSKDRELATVALFISVMMVGFCACMCFLSLAYSVHILAMSALAVALKQRLQADGNFPDLLSAGQFANAEALPA
ncbi:MAG: O-antigen ligase family protein [Acidobacteriota bacterium]|nr:O-antigen ligase family protein [Acidobacteriota bacterium]